ncbi:MAG: glycosyl hydrolase family 8 [Candidatus Margulisiibacteriota bacterium]
MGIVRWVRLKLTTPEPITMGSRMSRRTFLGLVGAGAAVAVGGAVLNRTYIMAPPAITSAHEVAPTRLLLERFELQEGNLWKITRDRIDKSILTQVKGNEGLGGYFLHKSGTENLPVYFIHSPTQFGQIVSEGMGYWMKILTNAARRLDPTKEEDKVLLRKYQETFNGLVRGTIEMINNNPSGLPGWRCYYNPELKKIEFRSKQERASATDADLYIADALMDAELLAKEGIFEPSPEFHYRGKNLNYTGLTNHMASRIKAYDVEEMNGRHILRVSDMWGSRDFKGALTFNPSYARLSVLFRIAQRDADRDFWLKLRYDSFELIDASHQFASRRYQEMLDSAQESADGKWVRLDGPEAHLLESLMFKLSPLIDDKLPEEYAAKGLEYSVEGHLAFVEGKSVRANLDGSRDISKDTFEFIRDEIDAAGANLFFPDQVEVEVNEKGEYLLRPEIGAQNLDFTEGYDAIRVYAELGEDLLMHNDSMDDRVPEEYRVSGREHLLLEEILGKKAGDPKLVRANRYHNAVALSAYFMARAGLATYKQGEIERFDAFRDELETYAIGRTQGGQAPTDIFDFINQQAKRGPQYYNASLALKILTSFLARDTEYSAQAVPLEKVSRVPAERDIQDEGPLAPVYTGAHEDLDYLLRTTATDFKRPAEYLTQDIPEVNREVRGTPNAGPIFTVEAERRYFHAKGNLRSDSPKSQYEFGKACLSVGRYREAAQVYFELLKTAPSPDKPIDEYIITESIRRLSDILRTINFPQPQIEDLFEWLLKREKPGKKTAYLRLAYIKELNQSRRITRALTQEKLLLDEITEYFLPHSAWDRFAVDVQEVMLAGDNGHNPLPAQEFLASAWEEMIFSYANTYSIELDKFGFPRKIYNRDAAFSLANLALGYSVSDHSAKQGETYKLFADHIKALRSSLSGDLKGRLQLAQARIHQNAAYQTEEDMQARLAFSLLWRNHFYDKEQTPEEAEACKVEMVREYEIAVKALDEALPYFDQAVRSESSGAANPTRLAEMLDGALSAYEFKIRLLAFRLRANETDYAFKKAYKRGIEIPDTTEKVQDKMRPILNKFVRLLHKQNAGESLTSDEKNLLDNNHAIVEIINRVVPVFKKMRSGRMLTPAEKILLSENEEIGNIYFAVTVALPLTPDDQKLLSVYNELVEIYFRYQGRISPVSGVMRRTARQILDAFKDPLGVKISEAVRWGLLPDTVKQAVQQIVSSEESADPRNVMWGLWARRLTNLYHGLGANIQDKSFLDEALDEALVIPDIWMSNPALRALTMVENTLKMTEILHDYRNLPDLVSQSRTLERWGSEMRTLLEVLIEAPAQPVELPDDLSDKVRNYINTIREHRGSITQVFETDPTLEAKILTNQANLIYWNADVEFRLALDKYPKDEDGEPVIGKDEKEKLQQAKLADYENALTKYRLALQIDPHIIDSLNGSVQLSIEVKRDQDAFYFLMRTLRAMAGAFVPPYKQREILSGINTLNEENEAREALVATDQRLTMDMRAALTKASKYMENLQEINVYHLQNLMEIFRAF